MIENLLGVISKTKIWGIIPLDLTLHFIIGSILYLIILKFSKKKILAFLTILILALFKEYWDSFRLNAKLSEQLLDILASIIYPTLSIIISKFKKI